jgi:hypothetical protein
MLARPLLKSGNHESPRLDPSVGRFSVNERNRLIATVGSCVDSVTP